MKRSSGTRPNSSMAVSGARSAIKKSPRFSGRAAPRPDLCGCSSSRLLRIVNASPPNSTTASPRFCCARTSAVRLGGSRRSTSAWQIEVNHREEKDTLGIGQAQLWNPTAIPKQPALAVAAYSALMLAALKVFGAGRGSAYAQLPRWRRNARRPSCLDLITLLRKEACEHPHLLAHLAVRPDSAHFVAAAAALKM